MSTQGRTSDQTELTPKNDPQTAPMDSGEGTNLLQRWVRLVQSAGLYGNEAGAVRLDELANGPTTPRIQTLTEIRAARDAAVAEEDAAGSPWWEDAVCAEDEPARSELPPLYPMPPLVAPPVPPALPAVGEGLLSRILSFGARWLGPVIAGLYPKDTAPPELTDQPYTGMDPKVWPDAVPRAENGNKCKGEKVEHRGGNPIHDECADSIPGNEASGGDWLVTTPEGEAKNFDAWTPADNTVWEVKTDQFDTSSEWLKERRLMEQISEFGKEQEIANRCGYNFKVAVRDAAQYEMLKERLSGLIEVVHRWECL